MLMFKLQKIYLYHGNQVIHESSVQGKGRTKNDKKKESSYWVTQ